MDWGNVVIVRHAYREGGAIKNIDSVASTSASRRQDLPRRDEHIHARRGHSLGQGAELFAGIAAGPANRLRR